MYTANIAEIIKLRTFRLSAGKLRPMKYCTLAIMIKVDRDW